ncbi:type I secretion system permease/ATPase [Pseudomonas mosselii]|uniref:type I secretion system permease/ATPase n=1 Tax=Pseudomonas mosselii TaxID=78327 RepID=UPI002447A57C|nr:type I secretion system permease/ATPase [Pseudomonas mosselii]MDH0629041.1 type I secretion system permease/ATPase [Pseudomonas mosselii]MDH0679464.1 type I secretion system permease/ATPase [Pseudomonas mosselii]MDH0927443.1 type I secretion system permease/ATPase [Pseudomonas mosselii]MDH1136070.1 type I secretion system permease/ATPase [Pseudomonas mosselii]MDH1140698.1 type I secretion system permease/ATPase [Pseudomonas mosselii]
MRTAPTAANEVLRALRACRAGLGNVALFTAVINLLMLAPALYMLQVYDRVLSSRNEMTLLMLSLMVLGVFAFMGLLEWLRSQVVIRLGTRMDMNLNPRVFEAAYEASLAGHRGAAGQMLADLTALRQFATGQALFAFFDAPWFPVYLLVMFLFSPWLGLMALLGAVLLTLLAWVNERLTQAPFAEAGQLSQQAGLEASANLRNAEVIEAMGMLAAVRQRWARLHHGFLARQNLGSERTAAVTALTKTVRLALQSLVLGLGAWLAIEQLITPGMMIAGSILMARVLAPIDQLIGAWRQWSGARLAYQRLSELLRAQPPRPAGMPLPAPLGKLTLEQVGATQPGSSRLCLNNLGFELPAGESLGIIGPSGSGKSTLARLLVGAVVPASGKVRLDGADLRVWDRGALGQHIGYLPQDVQLFAGSIADNIARLGAVDAQQVVAAAQLAGVHDMILKLPGGYDTLLGEGGLGLSGGQRQRIGLARALYGLPALIVLDEPNSNLDEAGEQALVEAIARLREHKRTLILITHKSSLLAGLDNLLMLKGGQLQAFGPTARVLQDAQRAARPAPAPVAPSSTRNPIGLSVTFGQPRA